MHLPHNISNASQSNEKEKNSQISNQLSREVFGVLLPDIINTIVIPYVPLSDLAMLLYELKGTVIESYLRKIVNERRADYRALEDEYGAAVRQRDTAAIREILLQGYIPEDLKAIVGASTISGLKVKETFGMQLVEVVIFPEIGKEPAIESFLTADKLLALGAPLPQILLTEGEFSGFSFNKVFSSIINHSILDIGVLYLALRNDPAFLTKQYPKSGDTLLHHIACFDSHIESAIYEIALDWIFDGRLIDLTIQNNAGKTPVQLLAENAGSSEGVCLVCARFVQAAIKSQFAGLNINQLFSNRTLFYRVISLIRSMPDMIQLAEGLLDQGADPTLCGSENYNAIAALSSLPKYFADGVKSWEAIIQRRRHIEDKERDSQYKQKDEQALLKVEALLKRVNEYAAKKAHENKPSVVSSSTTSSSSLQNSSGRRSSSSELSRETPKPNSDSGVNEVAGDLAEREQKQSTAPVGGGDNSLPGQANVSIPHGHASFYASSSHSSSATLNLSPTGPLPDPTPPRSRDETTVAPDTAAAQQQGQSKS